MKTAIYIRVSTDEQAKEGFSIAAQKERLTAYAYSQEWDIVDYYVDDGYSAKDTVRPHLQRLISDVKEKKIDVVLVHKLDRFTRSVKDLYILLDEFDRHKCGFRSAQEQFDTTTSMGRAMMGMLGIFAQWERETIAERVYIGMEQKHLSGKRNGAIAPKGYDLVEGLLVKNEEAPFIQRLFKMYQEHQGVMTMCRKLNNEGHNFHYKTLHYILSNPIYCGRIRWNYRTNGNLTGNEIIVDGDHEAIISKEDFDHVQALMNTRKNKGKAATSEFVFTKIAKCGRCGFDLVGASRKMKAHRYKFYRCSNRVNHSKCDLPHISEEAITRHLLKEMKVSRKAFEKMFKDIDISRNERTEIDEIERELNAVAKRKRKWQYAYANDAITLQELKSNTEEDKQREKELRIQLEKLPQIDQPQLSKEEIFDLVSNLHQNWGYIEDDMAKKQLLNDLVDSIVVDTSEKPRPHHTHEIKLSLKVNYRSI